MDAERLRDVISRGMGNVARVMGEEYDVFRPTETATPLASGNRIMRLPIVFDARPVRYQRPRGFERVIRAAFDGINVNVGDYLCGSRGTLFVAAVPPVARPLCVLTNSVVSVLRSSGSISAGLNSYGGVVEEGLELVLSAWPVQFTVDSRSRGGILPVDSGRSASNVLFPLVPVPIKAADLLQDDAGRRYVVRSCSETEMGWCLSVAGTEV